MSTHSSGTVSLRDRLKQYQSLKKENSAGSLASIRQQELEFIAKRSPMQSSLKKLELRGTPSSEKQPPKTEVIATKMPPQSPDLNSSVGSLQNKSESSNDGDQTTESLVEASDSAAATGGAEESWAPPDKHPAGSAQEEPEQAEDVEEVVEEIVDEEGHEEIVDEEGHEEIEEEEVFEEEVEGVEIEEEDMEEEVIFEETENQGETEDEEEDVVFEDLRDEDEDALSYQELMDEKSVDEFASDVHPTATSSFVSDDEAPDDELLATLSASQDHQDSSDHEEASSIGEASQASSIGQASQASSIGQDDPKSDNGDSEQVEGGFVAKLTPDDDDGEVDIESGQKTPTRQVTPQDVIAKSRRATNEGFADVEKRDHSGGLPPKDIARDRFRFILGLAFVAVAVAITAIILPFVLDYGDDSPGTSGSARPTTAPVPSPVPTPTPPPTEVTAAPSQPAVTPSPNGNVRPTGQPVTKSPTPAPTDAPVPTAAPTTQRLGQLINVFLIPISGEEAFEDKNSPQYKSAVFLANDGFSGGLASPEELADRYAAVTLYYATGGDNWNECSLDDEGCDSRWLNGDHCDWFGLTCNLNGRTDTVTFDSETNVGLSGSLPPEIYEWTELESIIIVDETNLTGPLPQPIRSPLRNMREMVLQGSGISGSIPDGFLANSPLELLLMGGNELSGGIPRNLNNATLRQIDFGGNQLSGRIPDDFGSFVQLDTLSLSSNELEGPIPDGLLSMESLERLYLNDNPLSGVLSSAIAGLTSIQELKLGASGISGGIPDELFGLPNLEVFDVGGANLGGPLSSSFFDLGETLRQLRLENNNFSGTVPNAFGLLTNLNVLHLDRNDLTGSISSQICDLRGDGPDDLQELTVDCQAVSCNCCTQCFG